MNIRDEHRILFFMMPLYGHITPNLLLVHSMCELGYKVYCVGNPKHFGILKEYGAHCISYHKNILQSFDFQDSNVEEDDTAYFAKRYTRDNLEWNITNGKILYEFAYHTLEVYMKTISPNIVLYDSTAIWGLILGKKYHLPCISIEAATDMDEVNVIYKKFYLDIVSKEIELEVQNGLCTSKEQEEIMTADEYMDYSQLVTSKLNKKINMLAEIPIGQPMKPDKKFAYVTKDFYKSYALDLGNVEFYGFQCDTFKTLPKKEGIFVTRGTVTDFYSMRLLVYILKALSQCDEKITVTTGGNFFYDKVVYTLGMLPKNICIQPFVNQLEALSSHKFMISHGGLSGVREAVMCETPFIMYPGNYHDYQVGLAVEKCGIGIVLKDRQLSRGNTDELLKAVDIMLNNSMYSERIREIRNEFLEQWKKNRFKEYLETLI